MTSDDARHDRERIAGSLLSQLRIRSQRRRYEVAKSLAALGPDIGSQREPALQVLLQMTEPEHEPRLEVLGALASIGRDDERALERVMSYAAPRPARIERIRGWDGKAHPFDTVMYERGLAIDASGYFAPFAERVLPTLVEAMTSFEEFDPDESYSGDHGRVCFALMRLGPYAAGALPHLVDYLQAYRQGTSSGSAGSDWPAAMLRAVAAMGPAAAPAREFLEAWSEEFVVDEDDSNVPEDLAHALAAARGEQ